MNLLPVLRAELYRLACLPSVRFALLAPSASAMVRIGWHALRSEGAAQVSTAEAIVFEDPLATAPPPAEVAEVLLENGFGPMAAGLRAGGMVLTLVLLLLGALCVVRERERGAWSLQMLAASRLELLSSKFIAILLTLLASAGLLFACSAGLAAALFDLGDYVDEGFVMATSDELWADTWRGFLGVLPGLLAAGSFGLLLSCLSSSTPMALTATLLPFLFFEIAEAVSPFIEKWAFVPYTPFLGDSSTLDKLRRMAEGVSDAYWMEGELRMAVLVPLLHVALYFAFSWTGLRLRSPV